MGIEKVALGIAKTCGKRRIPRYLYHFTNKANYESMLQDGVIKMTKDGCGSDLNGVFMVEFKNLTKRWKQSPGTRFRYHDLQTLLFKQASKKNSELVVLRISTKNISAENICIRSQHRLDGCIKSNAQHMKYGDTIMNKNLYTQRKEALEYIYPDEIPMSLVEKAGETHFDPIELPEKVLAKLFKGQPEEKCLNVIENNKMKIFDDWSKSIFTNNKMNNVDFFEKI